MPANTEEVPPRHRQLLQSLTACLEKHQSNSTTALPGFDSALRAPATSVSAAFQKAGFWPWLAYWLSTSRDGQVERSLSQLSDLDLQLVIDKLTPVQPHGQLLVRVQAALNDSSRARYRRGQLQRLGIEIPPQVLLESDPAPSPSEPPCSPPSLEPHRPTPASELDIIPSLHVANAPKRRRVEPSHQDTYQPLGTVENTATSPMISDAGEPEQVSDITLARHEAICQLPVFKPVWGFETAYPEAKHIPLVLGQYLCRITSRSDTQACLMVSIPKDPSQDGRLVLDIRAEEVELLTAKLFQVRIRTRNHRRSIEFESGATMKIPDCAALSESDTSTWHDLFGAQVAEAMMYSGMRFREISIGEVLSDCSSVQIPAGAECPARLCLVMDTKRLANSTFTPSSVKAPLDVNDDELVAGFEVPISRNGPTPMSYLLLKFDLYGLCTRICSEVFGSLRAPSYDAIQALDSEISALQEVLNYKYLFDTTLPVHHAVQLNILFGYSHQLTLLLHRPILRQRTADMRYSGENLLRSQRKCIESSQALLIIHRTLYEDAMFRPYQWYNRGLGSFHAFHAAVCLAHICTSGMSVDASTKDALRRELQGSLEIFEQMAKTGMSAVCQKAAPVLKKLLYVPQLTTFLKLTETSGMITPQESQHPAPSMAPDSPAHQTAVNSHQSGLEFLEEPIDNLAPQQWLSPSTMGWEEWETFLENNSIANVL
ncbi:hypothetical protein CDV31_010370 [Fusarium ambrosium]|uniref:Transcription factor domain-containing protein n=1 Tax=Fusarium ambrosium TaxID=131363 RepID=A0A428TNZ7_9HYPO|nr:hypothetical protein CDV31_010370 [Fusarium ambrosium]